MLRFSLLLALFTFSRSLPNAIDDQDAIRFAKEEADLRDVALGEIREYELALHYPEQATPPQWILVSSCDCLSARFVKKPTKTGAIVKIRVDGIRIEDIDGVISLENDEREVLAEHVVKIRITRKPFVSPRTVNLVGTGVEFEVTVGYAFENDAEQKSFEIEDLIYDDSRVELVDWIDDQQLELEYHLKAMKFPMQVIGDEPYEGKIEVVLLEPRAKFSVPVKWRPQ